MSKQIYFDEIIIRQKLSSRGGGIEIDLSSLGFENHKMTAYQNYLGGGMLGRVMNDCTYPEWESNEKLSNIAEQLRKYMFEITNSEDEWESQTYEQNQKNSVSAY